MSITIKNLIESPTNPIINKINNESSQLYLDVATNGVAFINTSGLNQSELKAFNKYLFEKSDVNAIQYNDSPKIKRETFFTTFYR